MGASHWSAYHAKWNRLKPPLRPAPEVVSAMREALRGRQGSTLLLGVTPELADVSDSVTAVDRDEGMIRGVWPGDSESRRAVRGDWRALPCGDAVFDAAVGDGSLNAVTHPAGYASLLGEIARVLRPGARAVFRVFCRPDANETVDEVLRSGSPGSFHAFKWRLAMAVAAATASPNVPVRSIHGAFVAGVHSTEAFALDNGWELEDLATIEVYRASNEVYSFPTRTELMAAIPSAFVRSKLVETSGYELCERCPLLILELPAAPERPL